MKDENIHQLRQSKTIGYQNQKPKLGGNFLIIFHLEETAKKKHKFYVTS